MTDEQRKSLEAALISGCRKLDYPLEPKVSEQLLHYLELLVKWNSAYNLSAIRDPEEMLYKHLLDSLSLATHLTKIEADRIIDVGTGPGLPGIPLAICFPERQFTLLDSAGKKTRFLLQTVHTLGLNNVQVHNGRVEQFNPDARFDLVLSRAFASLNDMLSWCSHLPSDEGVFWAMKGVLPQDELSDLEKHYMVESLRLQVPGAIGERCLIIIKSKAS